MHSWLCADQRVCLQKNDGGTQVLEDKKCPCEMLSMFTDVQNKWLDLLGFRKYLLRFACWPNLISLACGCLTSWCWGSIWSKHTEPPHTFRWEMCHASVQGFGLIYKQNKLTKCQGRNYSFTYIPNWIENKFYVYLNLLQGAYLPC